MNRSNRIANIVLLVASAGSLAFLLLQVARARDVAASLASAQRQHGALRRDVENAERRARQVAQAQVRNGNSVPVPAAGGDASSKSSNPATNAIPNSFVTIALNPKLRALHLKLTADIENSILGKRLIGLRPDQIERIRAAEIEREAARLDLAASAHANGLTIADPGIKTMNDQLLREYNEKLRAALGPEGVTRLRAGWSATGPIQQPLADWFAMWANMNGAPLTAAQGRELGRILSENTKPEALQPTMGYWARAHRVDWDAALPQIGQAGLSPAQFAAIDAVLAEGRSSKGVEQLTAEVLNRYPEIKSIHVRTLGLVTEIGYDNVPGLPPPRKR